MAKALLFTGFRSRHNLRFFEKRVNTSVFCVHQRKKSVQKGKKNAVIYRGLAPPRAKKMRKYQRFGVQKWPKHRYLHCFVLSTFSWNCKNRVNTSIFCDQPAKNVVIYSVSLLCFQKHWYLQCFVHLGSQQYWYLQHFPRFCMAPAKDVKTQKCCNLQHFVTFKKRKIVRKMSKRRFFSILGTLQTGGGRDFALGDAYERPGFRPKSFPPPSWRIFGVFRGPGGICQRTRGEPAEPNLSAYARQPARGPTMLAHLVAMLAYVGLSCGLCWPSLGLCWTILKAMWADREVYVGRSWSLWWPMVTHVEPKDPKNGNSKKTL